ncbi:MAG: peptidylprolyl isomerase [Acutalibacteraceae bacterium]
MAKNESSKSKAEVYREERKARIAKAAKQNAKSIEKRTAASNIIKKVVAIVLAVAIVGGIAWKLVDDLGVIERLATAVTIGDTKVTAAQFNYYYTSQYQQMAYYANYYQQNLGYSIGFDTSVAPDEQNSTEKDEDGNPITWAQHFSDAAVEHAQFVLAYYGEAVKADYKLTEDEQAEINETIENYRSEAAENNYSLNAYLRQSFGGGFNEKTFKKQLEMETLAQNFYNDKRDELKNSITDDEIKKEYEENKKDYNYTDVRYYPFNFTTLTAKEGETDEALKARQEEANNKVIAEAKAIYEKLTDEKSFTDAITAFKNEGADTPSDKDFTTLSKNATYSTLTSAVTEEGADWAFDNARKAGDKTMITGESGVYIIFSVKPSYAMNSVDVRHCLIKFEAEDEDNVTEAEKKAAYDNAKALYDEWLAGEKTEDTFKKMAEENSADEGSASSGGLYEGIRVSDSYMQEFEDWSFDPSRKAGDSGIIETDYGYHIMYFVSNNTDDLDWKNTIKENKGAEALENYNDALLAEDGSYPIDENARWTAKVSKKFCDKIRKNIAYSSAR